MGEPTAESQQKPKIEAPVPQEEPSGSPQNPNAVNKNNNGGTPRNAKYDNNRKGSRNYNQRGTNNGASSKHFHKYNQPAYGVPSGYMPSYGVADYNPMYYNQYQQQQMYAAYQNPMVGQAYAPPVVTQPALASKPAKVEITNKSGEHIDIASIAHPHSHAHQPSIAPVVVAPAAVSPSPVVKIQSPAVNAASAEPTITKPEEPKKDTIIVNDFLEQVKRRKAALVAKKASEEAGSVEPSSSTAAIPPTEPKATASETAEVHASTSSSESANAENTNTQTEGSDEKPESTETKPLTLAEKLKLKRMQAAKQSGSSSSEDSKVEEVATTEQPSVDDSIAEESKVKEPEVEELEPEKSIPEEIKPAEPISEEVKSEEPEFQETKSEEPNAEEVDSEELKVEEQKTEVEPTDEEKSEEKSEEKNENVLDVAEPETADEPEVDDSDKITVTDFLKRLNEVPAVDDIYSFKYPEDITPPNDRYKRDSVKYTYGPEFLFQFKDKINVKYDPEWMTEMTGKIVIPPKRAGSSGRGDDRFSKGKVGSLRAEGRSNSRSNSKRKSKKDDRRSNRSYTSRKDRERFRDEEAPEPKVEVAPLVPSANRWVPKSKMKKTEVKLAPDGTEIYEPDDVSRKMKSLLNKLTLEMFDPISDEIMKIANQSKWQEQGETLKIVIEQIFHKACDEPHWSSMYAQLCGKVVKDLDDSIKDSETPDKTGSHLVLHYLVQRCQTEFQKGWTDQLPANEDGTPLQPEMMSDEYYKMAAAKRRGLGLVRFIGFLYRSNLLTSRMVFFCFKRLMKDIQNSPTEDTLESVCELLETIGEQFEQARIQVTPDAVIEGSSLLDTLFEQVKDVIENGDITSRIKFKLIDIVELRENRNWNSTKKNDGPKTISQIHEEEALKRAMEERERENNRHGSRGGSRRMNSERNSSRRDFAPQSHNQHHSRDGFQTTRSSSVRHLEPKKEEQTPTPTKSSGAANMFDALMDAEDD